MPPVSGQVPTAPTFTVWQRWYLLGPGQAGGRVSAAWSAIIRRDPLMREVQMIIDLVLGGGIGEFARLAVSTTPLTTTSERSGSDYSAIAALIDEPGINQEYTFGDGASSARSIVITIDSRQFDINAIVARGGMLSGFAEVYLQVPNGDHDTRYVLMRGEITGVRFGSQDGPLGRVEVAELDIVDPKETIGAVIPPWVVTKKRWTDPHKSGNGQRYPIILNNFGAIPAIRVTDVATGSNHFVFAYGHGFTVQNVYVNGVNRASGHATYGWSLVEESDDRGIPVSYIDFTNGATAWEDSDAVYVRANHNDELTVVDALRHVMESFTELGTQGTNAELYATAVAKMPRFTGLQVCINGSGSSSAATGVKWAEAGFLESFPMVSMAWENGGYGPIVTDRRGAIQDEWISGQHPCYDRETFVEETPKADLFNRFTLKYDYDAQLDVYNGVLVRDEENSTLCQTSQSLIGRREYSPIESEYITSDNLANYVIDWMVEHYSFPAYVVDYVCSADVLWKRRRGDLIAFSEPEFG